MASVNLDIASNLGIVCRSGDTFKLTLSIQDSSNNPIDTTAYTFTMVVKDGSTTILSFSDSDFTKNVDGTLIVNKSAADMDAVSAGTYRYDIQSVKTSDSFVQTWVFGNFTVKEDYS